MQSTLLPSASSSSSSLLEKLLKENSELTERVTSLSQDRAALKHRLTLLERQLRRTENELAKVTTETENRPISDVAANVKVGRKHLIDQSVFKLKHHMKNSNYMGG